jgi:hypothetical protein
MGKFTVPGTTIQYDNPKQVDQTTNIPALTGKPWKPSNYDTFRFTYPTGVTGIGIDGASTGNQGIGSNMGDPQPGTFDASKPLANPVVFRNGPVSVG